MVTFEIFSVINPHEKMNMRLLFSVRYLLRYSRKQLVSSFLKIIWSRFGGGGGATR